MPNRINSPGETFVQLAKYNRNIIDLTAQLRFSLGELTRFQFRGQTAPAPPHSVGIPTYIKIRAFLLIRIVCACEIGEIGGGTDARSMEKMRSESRFGAFGPDRD